MRGPRPAFALGGRLAADIIATATAAYVHPAVVLGALVDGTSQRHLASAAISTRGLLLSSGACDSFRVPRYGAIYNEASAPGACEWTAK